MDVDQLRDGLATTAIALRGYNVHNLGRSQELLEHDTYGPRMADWLGQGSEIAADLLKRPVDLVSQVKSGTDTTLESYGEAIAMIVSVELAQLEILREDFDVDYTGCQLAFGYSLGEITALVAAGTISFADALAVPLLVSEDCVVSEITPNVPVLEPDQEALPGYIPSSPVLYNFEINAGEAQRHGISVGSRVRFLGFPDSVARICD